MTYKVLKSDIAKSGIADFDAVVRNYSVEMLHWHEREAAIAKQAPLPERPVWGADGEKDPFKASAAFSEKMAIFCAAEAVLIHPIKNPSDGVPALVRPALNDQFEPDYEIVNDDPSAEQVLRSKKNDLLGKIIALEQEAIEAAQLPLGRRRLASHKEQQIKMDEA